MDSKTRISGAFFGFVLILLSACSSSGTLNMVEDSGKVIHSGKSASLDIRSGADEDSQEAVHRMRGELFGRLVSEGVFFQVVQPNQPADYRMIVQLGDVTEVSQGARIFLGILAGSNELTANVTVFEQTTGQKIKEFVVTGESASHPMSSENGLEDAVREAVSNIIVAMR